MVTTSSESPAARILALVTGASSGIGVAFAHVLAEHGCDLVLTARDAISLGSLTTELRERYGVTAAYIVCDLSEPSGAEELYGEVKRRGLVIDVLINNAGFNSYGPFADVELSTALAMIQVNLASLVILTKLFLRDMIVRRTGKILNVGSTAGFGPAPYVGVYAATKAFVLSFSESVSAEVRGTGVTVGVLCPGSTESGFATRAGMLQTKVFSGKLMTAKQVADLGYQAMMRGRMTTITGFKNWFQVWSMRFAPRSIVVRIAEGLLALPKANARSSQ
jgi:short-subunit dehydrogenase